MICLDYYYSSVLQIVTIWTCTPFSCNSNLANQCTNVLGLEYLYLTYKLSVQKVDNMQVFNFINHIHERA